MTPDEVQAEREAIHGGVQRAFAEHEDGALVVGWFMIAEIRDASGKPYLAYRTGDINGDGLKSWNCLGYLRSAVQSVEQQCWETTIDAEDDDNGD